MSGKEDRSTERSYTTHHLRAVADGFSVSSVAESLSLPLFPMLIRCRGSISADDEHLQHSSTDNVFHATLRIRTRNHVAVARLWLDKNVETDSTLTDKRGNQRHTILSRKAVDRVSYTLPDRTVTVFKKHLAKKPSPGFAN